MNLRRSGVTGVIALSGVLSACGGAARRDAGVPRQDPRMVMVSKAEPPYPCRLLTTVQAPIDQGYWSLRERAADVGANYVVMDAVQTKAVFMAGYHEELVGRAFWCPPFMPAPQVAPVAALSAQSPPLAGVTPPASGECAPPCSPGYECRGSVCAAQCNPACGAAQLCGADRVCRAGAGR
jgi:hypothetical protein